MIRKVGLAPGTAIYTGDIAIKDPKMMTVLYDSKHAEINEYHSYSEVEEAYAEIGGETKSWIHIEPISDQEAIARLCALFGMHSLVAEDVLSVNHRPKAEDHDDYLFIIVKYAHYEEGELNFYQISFVLKEHQLISFADCSPDRFDVIKKRFEKADSRIRKEESQYLLFALIDFIVDHYFMVLESIGDEIEELEDEILYNPTKESIENVHMLKRALIELKKAVWPMREVINMLMRSDDIKPEYQIYYKDVYDHIIDIIDIIEGYRETVSSFLDIYLSTLSNRMNEIMKTLSIIGTIFIPLSFLTGYFGMNFKYETVLQSENGYMWSNLLMLSIPIGLLVYFRFRKWF